MRVPGSKTSNRASLPQIATLGQESQVFARFGRAPRSAMLLQPLLCPLPVLLHLCAALAVGIDRARVVESSQTGLPVHCGLERCLLEPAPNMGGSCSRLGRCYALQVCGS